MQGKRFVTRIDRGIDSERRRRDLLMWRKKIAAEVGRKGKEVKFVKRILSDRFCVHLGITKQEVKVCRQGSLCDLDGNVILGIISK